MTFFSFKGVLRYKSKLTRFVETFIFLPLFVLGSSEEKQTLIVNIFDHYQEDAVSPRNTPAFASLFFLNSTLALRVYLQYKAATGFIVEVHSKRLQIYRARLQMHAVFTGLRCVFVSLLNLKKLC